MKKTKNETQKTPKPEGYEIPVPKRGDVLGLFKKAATHQEKKSNTSRSPKK